MHSRPCLVYGSWALSEKSVGLKKCPDTCAPWVRCVQVCSTLKDNEILLQHKLVRSTIKIIPPLAHGIKEFFHTADWNTICARLGKKTLKMEIALRSVNEHGCSTQCRSTKVVGNKYFVGISIGVTIL